MKIISGKKSDKETTLHGLTQEMTSFNDERTILKGEMGVLESEKSKLMDAANDYTHGKICT